MEKFIKYKLGKKWYFIIATFPVGWNYPNSMGFPHSSVGEESACSAGDLCSIPESGRSPEEGNGNPLQFSCLENPMDRGTWWATVHGVLGVGHDLATKSPPPPPPPPPSKFWGQYRVGASGIRHRGGK